jgi:hypothetical protein
MEIETKKVVVKSVKDIETEIIDSLASKVDGADLMVIEVNDEAFLPLFQEALSNTKHFFLDTTILPVIRLKPEVSQSNLVLALVSLALDEALNCICTPANREECKEALFNHASIVIRNSSPELVMDIVTKEFDDLIIDLLAKP